MPYDPEKHHRRSIRLKGYDYNQPGAYFITIVTQHRERLFGEIVNGQMVLNEAGRMIQRVWDTIPQHHPGIETDAFVIMPNHIHGIIVITEITASASVSAKSVSATSVSATSVGAGLVPAPIAGTTANGATTTGAITNGATTNGATTNGATTNGATTNGAITNGATTNGATTNGAITNKATTRVAHTVGDIIGAFKSRTTVEYIHGVATYGWTPFPGKLWQRNYYEHIIRNERAYERIREYIVSNPVRWWLDRENPQRRGKDKFDTWLEHYSDIREEKPS